MCGINFLFTYSGITPRETDTIRKMNAEMVYRGPDDEGVWNDNTVALGMRRLSIIGLSNGHQPMCNEDESLVLVCNGEIYNYVELREALTGKHAFRTDSDCEVILHLYEDHGERCLEYLRGMFAFVLWDTRRRTYFAARDRIGEKPLYYCEYPLGFALSSELKALYRHVLTRADVDDRPVKHLTHYFHPIETTDTFIRQIKRLGPGECVSGDRRGPRFSRYWRLRFEPTYRGTYANAQDDVLHELETVARQQLRSDVKVGVLLSGGIDSSLVTSLCSRFSDKLCVLTAGYKDDFAGDERAQAQDYARELGVEWHNIELDTHDFIRYFEEYGQCVDDLSGDVAAIPQWGIYKRAKQLGIKVLLSGNGGDELFFGYPSHNVSGKALELSRIYGQNLPLRPRSLFPFFGSLLRLLPYIPFWPLFLLNNNRLISRQYAWKRLFRNVSETLSVPPDDPLEAYKNAANNGYDQISSILISSWLPNNCLFLGDKLGLGNSVEIRSPLVDYKLVFSLPVRWRYSFLASKPFLKRLLSKKKIVPNRILRRKKSGFTPPADYINAIINRFGTGYLPVVKPTFQTVSTERLFQNLGITSVSSSQD
jgi:asparagine synthase (glutamine-hydrolysing)